MFHAQSTSAVISGRKHGSERVNGIIISIIRSSISIIDAWTVPHWAIPSTVFLRASYRSDDRVVLVMDCAVVKVSFSMQMKTVCLIW